MKSLEKELRREKNQESGMVSKWAESKEKEEKRQIYMSIRCGPSSTIKSQEDKTSRREGGEDQTSKEESTRAGVETARRIYKDKC